MLEKPQDIEYDKFNPILLAKLYKFFKQEVNEFIIYKLNINNIPIKTFYTQNKKYFNKLSEICKKYKITPEKYIAFCVKEIGIQEPKGLLDIDNFMRYANNIKIKDQYKRIYNNFMKSANYVADNCILKNIQPVDFIRELIQTNKLAYEYICGNISMYYIASIKNIDKACEQMDQNSKDELSIIFNVHEKLNQDVQEAFLQYKNNRVSPLRLSEELIKQKLLNNNNINNIN